MPIQNLNPNEVYQLSVSGSTIATNRDSIPFLADVRDNTEGFIYAPSTQQAYNIPALKNVIDVDVRELVSNDETDDNDLVPRPLYNDALEALAIANETIDIQTTVIDNQSQEIANLRGEVDRLNGELDNSNLLRLVADTNADNLRQQLSLMSENIANSLQRSVLEGTQRASADARLSGIKAENESLKTKVISLQTEVDTLKSLAEGKDAQVLAGAKSSKELTVRVVQKGIDTAEDLFMDSIALNFTGKKSDPEKGPEPGAGKWVNGPAIELYNPTAETQRISFNATTVSGGWLRIPSALSLAPNETKRVSVTALKDVVVRLRPENRAQGARNYRGTLDIKSNTTTISLSVRLYKHKTR